MRRVMVAAMLGALAACSGSGSDPGSSSGSSGHTFAGTSGGIGTGTSGGGGTGTSGGGGTSGGTGTGGSSTGASSTGGGGTFSVSGTLAAVAGTDLSGTYVIGCAWVNGECGDATVDVQIGAAGSTASYALTDLQAGLTYYVLAWKDLDGDQQVSDGDLIGAALDEAGNVRAFTEGASGATLPVTPKQAPPQPTAIPGELVGLWSLTRSVGTTGLYNSWIFRADGSASNTVVFFQGGACDYNPGTRMDVTGSVALAGNALTFLPSGETTTTYDCSGNPKNVVTGYSRQRDFTWRVAAGSDGGPSLFLTEDQGSGPIETEFHAN